MKPTQTHHFVPIKPYSLVSLIRQIMQLLPNQFGNFHNFGSVGIPMFSTSFSELGFTPCKSLALHHVVSLKT